MLIKRLQGQSEKCNGYYYEFDMHSKPLGEGGMGVVYKGFKIFELTGNRSVVAIKAMFDGLPAEVYERAEREASIRLRNDNLVEMLGFICETEIDQYGMTKNKYYVVSEYLNGVVLSDLLSGQFKDKDGIEINYAKQLYTKYISNRDKTSIEIIRSILSGILALHDKGYIHRDIDPTNIMVTDGGSIKLIDFGIAKYVRSLGTIDKSLTSTGKFIGKAEFAAPELVLGDVRSQGYPTDIYAIGILFYQLLVGKLPFNGSKYEVLQMQLNDKMPVKNIKNLYLRKIIKKATEKNKEDRYLTVAELRVDLDKVTESEPNPLSRYWKHAIIATATCAACIGIFFIIDSSPRITSDKRVIAEITSENSYAANEVSTPETDFSEDFSKALAMLNSNDRTEANEGLERMKVLAEKNCTEAIKELGVTYCTYEKVLSPTIKGRRQILALSKDTASNNLSVSYLEYIKANQDISIDALYILGYQYWRQDNWDKGTEVLSKAQEMLSKSDANTFGEYTREELEANIKKYLELCRKKGK